MAVVHSITRAIASGDAGTLATLDAMARVITDATANPTTVAFARFLVVGATPYASRPQVQAARLIRNWLKSAWRFVDDPANRELLRAPDVMLQEFESRGYVAGDCDEAAVLGAALGMSVGLSAALNVVEFEDGGPAGYSHVFASLLPIDGPEITLDVTRPPLGSPVPRVVRWSAIVV